MQNMVGTSYWPAAVGLHLAEQTPVCCTLRLPRYSDNTLGFVHSSQMIEGIWQYTVAFPPALQQRAKWTLVTGISPSQMSPVALPTGNLLLRSEVSTKTHTLAVPCNILRSRRLVGDKVERRRSPSASGKPDAAEDISRVRQVEDACLTTPQADLSAVLQPQILPLLSEAGGRRATAIVVHASSPVPLPLKVMSARCFRSKEATKPVSSVVRGYPENKTICEHGKRKTVCMLCGGGSICIHNKQRPWCMECGGSARCSHGRQKSRCVDCEGVAICIHGKLRIKCCLC